ncbi:hypothetical protein GQ44DRAFT_147678 [Phaeosphaeriaceae sp. PMI808]|nr:hypothetical protein GQ44DRAFT_147678 [Phaeosphaeriaceae sp. PMI808]
METLLPSISNPFCRSFLSRFINSTHWPSILASDASAGRRHGVARRVVVMDNMALLSTITLLIAGVLTPIGLGETIDLGQLVYATFIYAPGNSAFGRATPPRHGYSASRVCDAGQLPCPGVNPSDTIFIPQPFPATLYQTYIPRNTSECFA